MVLTLLLKIERLLPGMRPLHADGYIALGLICVLAASLGIILVAREHRRTAAWIGTIVYGLCTLVPVLDALYSASFNGWTSETRARMAYRVAPAYSILGCAVIWGTLLVMSRIRRAGMDDRDA